MVSRENTCARPGCLHKTSRFSSFCSFLCREQHERPEPAPAAKAVELERKPETTATCARSGCGFQTSGSTLYCSYFCRKRDNPPGPAAKAVDRLSVCDDCGTPVGSVAARQCDSCQSTEALLAETRRKALEDVLDLIDEDRNPCAYGACGCPEAVKALLEKM